MTCNRIGLLTDRAMINDKMLSAFVLQGMGLPTSNTLAVFGSGPCYGTYPHVKTRDGLIAALANPPEAGLFGKPVDGSLGVGRCRLSGERPAGTCGFWMGGRFRPKLWRMRSCGRFPQVILCRNGWRCIRTWP